MIYDTLLLNIKMQPTFIFDFDGTIADSFTFVTSFLLTNLDKWKATKNINNYSLAHLKTLSATEILIYFGISIRMLPLILFKVRREMNKNIDSILPIDDIFQVLHTLHKRGHRLLILTSNSIENVSDFLFQHQSQDVIEKIYSDKSFFSKDKKLKKILIKHKLNPEHTIYIGDETRDIIAAKSNNLKSVAVTWGFQSTKALKKENPTVILDKTSDLLSIKF
jgi:phosphoglycolate phosphatase